MSEISDQDFLRVNRLLDLVSHSDLEDAQAKQFSQFRDAGHAPDLIDLLKDSGAIDAEKELRIIACRDALAPPPDDPPPTPLVAISSKDLPQPSEPTVHLAPQPPTPTTSRRRPSDVEEADKDPNNRFGHFVVLKEVGRGGMGRVYRAWDNSVGRIVALKVIETAQEENQERFVREAEIAGRLHHPAIATVYQAGTARGRSYIAMQFIEGAPVGKARLPAERAITLIRDAARALSYAHEKGIIHRDIKPGNLMVDKDGKLFLTDFGLAKQVVGDVGKQISVTGEVMGTPQFMSPEQASGDRQGVDARTDVYSLGATLYTLLADRPPFTAQGIGPLLMEVMEKKPPSLRELNRELSPELESVVDKAMEKAPGRRFATAAEFADALDRLLEQARFIGSAGLARRLARRWLPVAAIAVLFALAVRTWLPLLLVPPAVPQGPGEVAGLLAAATVSQSVVETSFGDLSPGVRGARIEADVLRRIDRILLLEPGHVPARVLRARAFYVDGRFVEARRAFGAVTGETEDYRVAFFLGLLRLHEALQTPPPLPALDAPVPEWETEVPSWPEDLAAAFRATAGAEPSAAQQEEFARDREAARAVTALLESRWSDAADELSRVIEAAPLPIYRLARGRATYLARRFGEVSAESGLREHLGAAMVGATASVRPIQALERALERAGPDPAATVALRIALARRQVEAGRDPGPHVTAGLQASPEGPRGREARGMLETARLRWREATGEDAEEDYRRAEALLGASPVGWSGRLAAVELRLGWASRRARAGGDPVPILEQALERADGLTQVAPEWDVPRLLRAEARIRQGRYDDAGSELEPVARSARARILAAELNLGRAERLQRRGAAFAEDAREARRFAMDALAIEPNHTAALVPAAAAALLLAQDAAARDEDDALLIEAAREQLDGALEAIPGHARARTYRGVAHFLRSAVAQRKGGDGRAENEAARADLDAALEAMPESGFARYMRGIVLFSLGRFAEARKDWERLLAADSNWNTPELRAWLEDAKSRAGK